jgi:hypothetical protein
MRSVISLLSLSALLIPVHSLYFYIDGTTPKCFYEELPKDTLVVGHYTAEEFNLEQNRYIPNENLNIFISVDVSPLSTHQPRSINSPFSKQHVSEQILIETPGSIRQRPPRRLSKRWLLRAFHIHCRRRWRPQDLLHALARRFTLRVAIIWTVTGCHEADA